MNIDIQILDERIRERMMPQYATDGSVAVDLRAMIGKGRNKVLSPGDVELIPTGFAMNIKDPDVGAFIFPRSGLGYKQGLVLANGTGVIDSDYQGEVMVALLNRGNEIQVIREMDRVAQMVFMPIKRVKFNVVENFSTTTARGEGGFGSTGVTGLSPLQKTFDIPPQDWADSRYIGAENGK